MEVHKTLGCGFIEAVYESALAIEKNRRHISFSRQLPMQVHYKGHLIGRYVADFVVEDQLVVELKAVSKITARFEAQIINYLAVSQLQIGLILNFGAGSLQIKRRVFRFSDQV